MVSKDMNITVREIGNSKGIIIPASALKQAGIGNSAILEVNNDCIKLKAIKNPRDGWQEAIKQNPQDIGEEEITDNIQDPELSEDWTW